MPQPASRTITVENETVKRDPSNSISIICGIVAVVTCCFSINIVTERYENARAEYIRARYIVEQTKPALLKTKESIEKKKRREKTVSFI